jgi:hypothetical protein
MGLVQKAFSDIITFSRSSNATRVGPDGLIQYAPHNLLLYSQEFDNAAWTKGANVTVTANAAAAPDGTVTADLVVSSASADSSTNQVFQQVTVASSQTYTASFWVRTAGANQNITVRQTANGVLVTNTTVAVTSTWQRVSVTFTASTNPGFAIRPDTVSNLNIYVWGAQLAVGPLALDYTPTTTAAVYGPRFDYDPVTLAARGLLIEEQRTNLLTYSQEFDNAAWVKSGATITANTTAAPDGTTTADTLTGNGVLGSHTILQTQAASADGKTFSVYLKAGTNNFAQIFFDNTGVPFANFDLSTGSLGSTGSSVTATITSAGDGWYRCVVYTSSSLATNPRIGLVTSSTAARSESNTLSTDIYLWGAQAELSATATSYIPTVASTVTRSADFVSVNTLSPWYNATEGTLFSEWDQSSVATGNEPYQLQFSDGTLNNRIVLFATSITEQLFVGTGGVAQAFIGRTTLTANQTLKAAARVKANDFALVLNGGAASTDTSGTVPTVTQFALGQNNLTAGTKLLNGHLRRVAYYPRALSTAELQALTA